MKWFWRQKKIKPSIFEFVGNKEKKNKKKNPSKSKIENSNSV